MVWKKSIIPYQELLGNYDPLWQVGAYRQHYTIPRAIRELWRVALKLNLPLHYTIPRAIRELWLARYNTDKDMDYTIPRAIRELWRVSLKLNLPLHYTIPRAIRELWPDQHRFDLHRYYTIPRAIRELWLSGLPPPDTASLYHTKSY